MGYVNSNTGLAPLTVSNGGITLNTQTGNDLIVNGGFSDLTGWSALFGCTIASVAGGQSGNCLEITRVDQNYQIASGTTFSVTSGKVYRVSYFCKSGTSGNEESIFDDQNGIIASTIYANTTASWVEHSKLFASTASQQFIPRLWKNTVTAGTMLFDTLSMYLVDTPLYTKPRTIITVTGEDSAADDLTNIYGGIVGQRIVLRGATAGHITVKNGPTSGLYLQADFNLTYTRTSLELECTALNTWAEINRAQVTE